MVEVYVTINQGEEGVIFALADASTGMKLGAYLSDENISGANPLSTKTFYAASLSIAVAAVARRTLSFFMCHESTV